MAAFFVNFSLMFKLKIISIAIVTSFLLYGLNSCTQKEEKVKEKPKNQLTLTKGISDLILDTASVNPLIDSLRIQFQELFVRMVTP